MANSPSPCGVAYRGYWGSKTDQNSKSIGIDGSGSGVDAQPGDLVLVTATWTGGNVNDPFTSCLDNGATGSLSYTKLTGANSESTTPYLAVWYAFATKKLPTNGTSISLSGKTTNGTKLAAAAHIYSGVSAVVPIDGAIVNNSAGAASTSMGSSSFQPQSVAMLVAAYAYQNSGVGVTHTGWTGYALGEVAWSATLALDGGYKAMTAPAGAQSYNFTLATAQINTAAIIGLIPTDQPVKVQSVGNAGLVGSESSQVVSPSKTTTKGNVLLVAVTMNRASAQVVSSVTDTAGNTYARVDRGAGTLGCELWWAPITTAWTTSDTLTVNFSAAVTLVEVAIQEWANVDTIVGWDKATEATGNSTGPSSGSLTPSYPFGVGISVTAAGATVTFSALSSGWVEDFSGGVTGAQLEIAHRVFIDKTAQSYASTISASNPWSNLIASMVGKNNTIAAEPSTNTVNALYSQSGTGTPTVTTTITGRATKAGAMLAMVIVTNQTSASTMNQPTDSKSNTWQYLGGGVSSPVTSGIIVWACLNAKSLAINDTIQVVIDNTVGVSAWTVSVYEFDNMQQDTTLIAQNNTFGSNTAPSVGSSDGNRINTVDLAIIATNNGATTLTGLTSGWMTTRNSAATGLLSAEGVRINSEVLNTTETWAGTLGASSSWCAFFIIFGYRPGNFTAITTPVTESVAYGGDTGVIPTRLFVRTVTEAIGFVGEALLLGLGLKLADAMAYGGESALENVFLPRNPTDNIANFSDALTRAVLTFSRPVTDSLPYISDLANPFKTWARTATDAIAFVSDTATRGAVFLPRFVFESIATSDAVTRIVRSSRSVTDALGFVSDLASKSAQILARPVAEAAGIVSDAATRAAYLRTRTATDAVGIVSDLAFKGLPRTVTEAIAYGGDVAARAAQVFARAKTEAVAIVSDVATKAAQVLSRTVLDADFSDNFAVTPHTDVVFKSIGTDATGTLNAWTGTGSIASNVVTFAANQVLTGGHPDWDDITLTGRFKWSTNSTPSFSMRNDGAGNYVYGLVDGVNIRIGQVTNNNFEAPETTAAVPLVNGTNYWFKASVIGGVFTVQVFADNAGAISATQVGSTVVKSNIRSSRGKIQIGCPFGGGSAGTTWGGAFANVLKVEGNIPGAGWSFGPGGAGWTSSEPAFALSSALAFTGSVAVSVNAPTAIGGSGYWFLNVTTLPNKVYRLRCWINAPAGGTGNFSVTAYNNGNTIISNVDVVYPTAGWQLATYDYTTPGDNTFTQVVLRVNSGGQGYFGLLQILPLQDPATKTVQSLIRTLAEAVALVGEATQRGVGRFANDLMPTPSDVARSTELYNRVVADAVAYVSDTSTRLASYQRVLVEAVGIVSDTAVRAALARARSATDALAYVADAAIKGTPVFARTATEAIGIVSDAAVRGNAMFRAVVEALSFTDSTTRSAAHPRTATDAAGYVGDTNARAIFLVTRAVTDALGYVGDAASRNVFLHNFATDALAFVGDAATRLRLQPRTATDAVGYVGDANASNRTFNRLVADALPFGGEVTVWVETKVKIGVIYVRAMVKGLVMRGRNRQ